MEDKLKQIENNMNSKNIKTESNLEIKDLKRINIPYNKKKNNKNLTINTIKENLFIPKQKFTITPKGNINLDLFKPLLSPSKQFNPLKENLYLTNNNNNKSKSITRSLKNSYEKSINITEGNFKNKDNSLVASEQVNRNNFLLKEIKKEKEAEIKEKDSFTDIKKKRNLNEELNLMKERAKDLLSKYSKTNELLLFKLKKQY